ncbi:MAG: hypothetical protein KKH61_21200 [Gammaproteobacteria bacterium]|uniref:Uncharacterized protein n=1 Tax=viral metagenome TaxID=1070528 RepID=A0A6H1ZB11_9ZZZZ|nr:hypothetical protein [Gammaproteobacteria bacterium]
MKVVLKVQKHPSGDWIYVSENRHIYFRRKPTADELAAMGNFEVFFGVFNLENGQSRFSQLTHSREW